MTPVACASHFAWVSLLIMSGEEETMIYYSSIAAIIKPILSNLQEKLLHFLVLLHLYHFMFRYSRETS